MEATAQRNGPVTVAPRRCRWRWLTPSLPHWLWLLVLVLLLTKPWRTAMVSADGDACMHWRVGETMLQAHQLVRADTFSHTRFGQPIISKEWLAELIFAGAGRWRGLAGLSIVAALVIATTFALLLRQLLREGSDPLVATLVTLLAMWAATTHWLARPHVFSFLMVLLWNDALRRYERDQRAGRLALVLGILTLFWVNLHGAFLAGFFILGASWLGAVIEWLRSPSALARSKILALTAVAAGCAVVSLANPSGCKLHLHNLAFLQSQFFTGWLAEYASTNFHSPAGTGFLLWLALLFFTLVVARPRLAAAPAVLLLNWSYFALYAGRNIPLLALLTAPIVALAWTDFLRQAPHRLARAWRSLSARLDSFAAATHGGAPVAAAAIIAIALAPRQTEMPADSWPVAATAFIQQHPEQFTGRMFNQYAWGGYLMQFLPDHPVFVDGRADFYGETLVKEFDDVTALHPDWQPLLAKHRVRWTLMPTNHRLNCALQLLPDWEPVYADQVATVFRSCE